MTSTWVKICGTTNLEDAQIAVEAGADALGFVFAKSPRQIDAKSAANIVKKIPASVSKIGVFDATTPQHILEIAERASIDGIQLHGAEQLHEARALRAARPTLVITLVISGREDRLWGFSGRPKEQPFDRLMLDNGGGGTGKPFNWDAAASVVAHIREHMPVIIAGGLAAGNVGEAIRLFRPWGVDVVTGVERVPGKKDPEKVRAFIRAVREADRAS